MKLVNNFPWIYQFTFWSWLEFNQTIPNSLLQFIIAALLAVAAAAPSSYSKDAYTTEKPMITIVSQSDVRNLDGSSQWR